MSAVHSVISVPPEVISAKWVSVAAPVAAPEVNCAAFAFTEGVAAVAADQFVAPTACRAMFADSLVPFCEYPT